MRVALFKADLEIPYSYKNKVYDNKLKKWIDLEVPVIHFEGYPSYGSETRLNYTFNDTLVFQEFSRGRSSVKAEFIGTNTTNRYEMFISDFEEAFNNDSFNGHTITGTFCFRKAGANYGVVLLDEEVIK